MGTTEARIQLSNGQELVIFTETGDAPGFGEISKANWLNRVPAGDDPSPGSYTDGRALSRLGGAWIWNDVPVTEEQAAALMELAL